MARAEDKKWMKDCMPKRAGGGSVGTQSGPADTERLYEGAAVRPLPTPEERAFEARTERGGLRDPMWDAVVGATSGAALGAAAPALGKMLRPRGGVKGALGK